MTVETKTLKFQHRRKTVDAELLWDRFQHFRGAGRHAVGITEAAALLRSFHSLGDALQRLDRHYNEVEAIDTARHTLLEAGSLLKNDRITVYAALALCDPSINYLSRLAMS